MSFCSFQVSHIVSAEFPRYMTKRYAACFAKCLGLFHSSLGLKRCSYKNDKEVMFIRMESLPLAAYFDNALYGQYTSLVQMIQSAKR